MAPRGRALPGARLFPSRVCGVAGFVGSAHIVSPAGELGRLRYEPVVLAPIEVWERCLSPMAMAKAGHALSAVCVAAMVAFTRWPSASAAGQRSRRSPASPWPRPSSVPPDLDQRGIPLHRSPPRLISRAIGVPLAPATNGPWRSLTDAEVRRSDDVAAGIAQIPKLTVLDSGHLTPGPPASLI